MLRSKVPRMGILASLAAANILTLPTCLCGAVFKRSIVSKNERWFATRTTGRPVDPIFDRAVLEPSVLMRIQQAIQNNDLQPIDVSLNIARRRHDRRPIGLHKASNKDTFAKKNAGNVKNKMPMLKITIGKQ
mmetsp:Transcript_73863/g.204664  ORF Transcript_73863/g.204664 Transcript_73863/m.204664 type:complete len:132 (-) Transcript_73863:83-478(-)